MTTTPATHEPGLVEALALLPSYAEEVLLGTVRDTHRAVSARAFGAVGAATGEAARPVRLLHDGISAAVYEPASWALRAVGGGLARAGRAGAGPRLEDSEGGRVLQSAVNGLIGARLREESPRLALEATVRVDGRVVTPRPDELRDAFPGATGQVVVLVHGLGEHEGHWEADRHRLGTGYARMLAAEGDWTPVLLRVNTGLSLSENGVAVSSLLQQVVDAWPVEVHRIALVGHSMGGLVLHAATAVSTLHDRPWVDRVSDLVTLGTPHLGADLARVVRTGAGALALAPELAAFGRILEHRSPGIRDLERGLPTVQPLNHVRYRLVSASLGREGSVAGRVLGDLLVRRGSASAEHRRYRRLFPDADLLHVHEADHFSLLNHPEVHEALRRWLC